jgi:putative transposase
MPQSLAQLYVHIVFSTKDHYPFIQADIEPQLFPFIGDAIKKLNGVPVLINSTADHIHILASLPRTVALSDFPGKDQVRQQPLD